MKCALDLQRSGESFVRGHTCNSGESGLGVGIPLKKHVADWWFGTMEFYDFPLMSGISIGMELNVSAVDSPQEIADVYSQVVQEMEAQFENYFCISTDHIKALKGRKKWVMLNEVYIAHATIPSWFKVIVKTGVGRHSFVESSEEVFSKFVSLGLETKRAGMPSLVALAMTLGFWFAYDLAMINQRKLTSTGVDIAMRRMLPVQLISGAKFPFAPFLGQEETDHVSWRLAMSGVVQAIRDRSSTPPPFTVAQKK